MTHKIIWSKIDSFKSNSSSSDLTRRRTCPVCGSDSYSIFLHLPDFQFYSDSNTLPKRTDICHSICQNCHLLYMNPCYTKKGFKILFKEATVSYGTSEAVYNNRTEWLYSNIEFKKDMTLIDIGTHNGLILSKLPGNVKKIGVDINFCALKSAKTNHPNIIFICSDAEELPLNISIDVITMFHVLEHIENPVRLLKNLLYFTKPETILALEVPILERADYHDINGFFSVHHLTHFTHKSLVQCLNLAGWEILKTEEAGIGSGYRVLARPSVKKKLNITINYQNKKLLFRYLSDFYGSLAEKAIKIEKINWINYCVIWGGGIHTEILYKLTPFFKHLSDTKFIIVDKDNSKWGKSWRGINIYSPAILPQINWNNTMLIPSSYDGQTSIIKEAIKLGVNREKIFILYNHNK